MKILGKIILGFFRFWYDFLIGDCWPLALGAAAVLAGGALLVRAEAMSEPALAVLVAMAMMALVVGAAAMEWRHKAAGQRR